MSKCILESHSHWLNAIHVDPAEEIQQYSCAQLFLDANLEIHLSEINQVALETYTVDFKNSTIPQKRFERWGHTTIAFLKLCRCHNEILILLWSTTRLGHSESWTDDGRACSFYCWWMYFATGGCSLKEPIHKTSNLLRKMHWHLVVY